MAPSAAASMPPAEIVFAQRLASNEPKIRRLALKKLKKYISSRSKRGGFSQEDLMKLWKGLHYCMWMQDKPLRQEELADSICALTLAFENDNTAVMYLSTYLDTECREWMSIDKWRIDKFMMLFRRMFRQCLGLLKSNKWGPDLTSVILNVLSNKVIHDSAKPAPEGIRYHLADIYLEELSRVGGCELSAGQTLTFLEPWISAACRTRNKAYQNHIVKRIFGQLILESPVGQDDTASNADDEAATAESDEPQVSQLQVDYGELSKQLFAEASGIHCLVRNRTPLYDLVTKFKALSEGRFPCEEEVTSGSDQELTDTDVNAAIRRLGKLENVVAHSYGKTLKAQELSKKKRKRTMTARDTHSTEQTACDGGQGAEQPAGTGEEKMKKKKKRLVKQSLAAPDDLSNDGSRLADASGSINDDDVITRHADDTLSQDASLQPVDVDHSGKDDGSGCNGTVDLPCVVVASDRTTDRDSNERSTHAEGSGRVPTVEASDVVHQAGITGKRKKRSKGDKQKSHGLVLGDDDCPGDGSGDIEIWIPNKRYKGPLKQAFAESQKKAATQNRCSADCESSETKKFATFVDSTEAAAAATASSTFFRRAASKVQSKDTSKKSGKKTVNVPAVTGKTAGSKNSKTGKRVSFGKSSAIGDTGLKFSTEDVFKPHVSPCQGVIKTRSVTAKDSARKAALAMPSRNHM